jgi:hypothetical protein
MYVCMHVCMLEHAINTEAQHIYTRISIHTYKQYIHAYMHICMHVYTQTAGAAVGAHTAQNAANFADQQYVEGLQRRRAMQVYICMNACMHVYMCFLVLHVMHI